MLLKGLCKALFTAERQTPMEYQLHLYENMILMEKTQIAQYLNELNDEMGAQGEDVTFLIQKLGLKKPDEVFAIVEKYYPRQRIKPASQFFIEELFEK